MKYSAANYEYIFDTDTHDARPDAIHAGAMGYRTKRIRAGVMQECETYPLWPGQGTVSTIRKRIARTRDAQKAVNERNARKWLLRRVNATFTDDDLFVTHTYADANMPADLDQVKRDAQNYFKRVRTYRARKGLPELKYVYAIERTEAKTTGRVRYHLHIIMSGMDRDAAEAIWHSGRSNTRRLQANQYQYAEIVAYLLKSPAPGARRYYCSKNLNNPIETYSDTKISRRKVERLVEDLETSAHAIYGALYPEYELIDIQIRRPNPDYVGVDGVYIYARMRRRDGKRSAIAPSRARRGKGKKP